jgi:surface antigen
LPKSPRWQNLLSLETINSASGSASGGASAGGTGSDGSKGDGGNAKGGSLAAFVASPVYGRVASTVPTRVTASPVIVSRSGVPCQKMTQTIDIGGQTVHASAVVCRHRDGTWQLNPTQSARLARAPAAQISRRP